MRPLTGLRKWVRIAVMAVAAVIAAIGGVLIFALYDSLRPDHPDSMSWVPVTVILTVAGLLAGRLLFYMILARRLCEAKTKTRA
jgi:uncharacterized membrane protein